MDPYNNNHNNYFLPWGSEDENHHDQRPNNHNNNHNDNQNYYYPPPPVSPGPPVPPSPPVPPVPPGPPGYLGPHGPPGPLGPLGPSGPPGYLGFCGPPPSPPGSRAVCPSAWSMPPTAPAPPTAPVPPAPSLRQTMSTKAHWKCRLCSSRKFTSLPKNQRHPRDKCRAPLPTPRRIVQHYATMHFEHSELERCNELADCLEANRAFFAPWIERRLRECNLDASQDIDHAIYHLRRSGKMLMTLRKVAFCAPKEVAPTSNEEDSAPAPGEEETQ
ncbi:hypothetical protein VD0002_g1101 [Verticillium dahliae]|nr:hypothetical protein VD0002_g1101 [Verticillium dahliae]